MKDTRGGIAEPQKALAYEYSTLSAIPRISLSRPGSFVPAGRKTLFAINWYSVGTTLCMMTIVTVLFAEIFRIV